MVLMEESGASEVSIISEKQISDYLNFVRQLVNKPSQNHLKNILSQLWFGWKRAEPAKSASSSLTKGEKQIQNPLNLVKQPGYKPSKKPP